MSQPRCRAPFTTVLALAFVGSLLGFAHAAVGDRIDDVEMPLLGGVGKHHLLAEARANVFVFIRSGQGHSLETLQQIARVEKELRGKSVHWVAIASSRDSRDAVLSEVRASGVEMPVLVDVEDRLYGKLGVALHPVIGITDGKHELVAYQPFTRINYEQVIRARVRHLLGEIDADELQRALDPPRATYGDDHDKAMRRLHFAEKLFSRGKHESALKSLEKSLEDDPELVAALVLKGRVLAAQGAKEAAREAFERALSLSPEDAGAREGLKALK